MRLDKQEKDFHLKHMRAKKPELTEEDKTVVSQTNNHFLWHRTPKEAIAGNKNDGEEMRKPFGHDVTHFVKDTTEGNRMYQLPLDS